MKKSDLEPTLVFGFILGVKLLTILLIQTWYVPDEYWQSLEVAHRYAFGYGELTWEWTEGIRSIFYPGIFTVLYKVLYYLGIDYPELLIKLPRILLGTLSAVSDYRFYKWSQNQSWALFLISTQWFWLYTCSRTLINTFETALVVIALSMFPFNGKHSKNDSNCWIWLAFLCFYVRPTSGALWVVLIIYNLITSNSRLRLVITGYLPTGLVTLGILTCIDSCFYRQFIFTPWEFFKLNVLKDISSFYGTHPWYWYVTQGLPAVLGVNFPFVLWAIFAILHKPEKHKIEILLLGAATLHLTAHSLIPHKEFRYILSLLPILLYLTQVVLTEWSIKASKLQVKFVVSLLLFGNLVPAAYFGLIHQRATLQVMPILRDLVDNTSSVLFLMPCHSTPLYSHLHVNISTRYVRCNPPLYSKYEEEETARFFRNPSLWWREEYAKKTLPNYVVMFDKLLPRVEFLRSDYRLVNSLPHTQFPEGEVSEKLLLFEKISVDEIDGITTKGYFKP